MINILERLFTRVAKSFPELELKMRRAGIYESPMGFVKRIMVTALYITTGIMIILFMPVSKMGFTSVLVFFYPLIFVVMFFYMMHLPDVKIMKKERQINKEIVFAGRFIILEIGSGVSLYNTMRSVSEHYKYVGQYFKEILQKVDMGTSMDDALNEEIELIPSNNLKRVMWQIVNSLRTGADMGTSLQVVLNQVSKEQFIEVQKYGRKLNPLAMFYMMIAVIIPSLGVTMLVILSSFIDLDINLGILLVIAMFLAFVQFMFLSIIKSSRPSVEL